MTLFKNNKSASSLSGVEQLGMLAQQGSSGGVSPPPSFGTQPPGIGEGDQFAQNKVNAERGVQQSRYAGEVKQKAHNYHVEVEGEVQAAHDQAMGDMAIHGTQLHQQVYDLRAKQNATIVAEACKVVDLMRSVDFTAEVGAKCDRAWQDAKHINNEQIRNRTQGRILDIHRTALSHAEQWPYLQKILGGGQ